MRLSQLSRQTGITFTDITSPTYGIELPALARGIQGITECHGLEVFTGAEAVDLAGAGIRHGVCIDAAFIREAFGIAVAARKDRGQRPLCLCTDSVDVGAYHTCSHQCTYCYATSGSTSAERTHDPSSPTLTAQGVG